MSGGERRPSPSPTNHGATDSPQLLLSSSAPTISKDDNPFLRQLELMLSKSQSNRAAAASRPSPTMANGSDKAIHRTVRPGSEGWSFSDPTMAAAATSTSTAPVNSPSLSGQSTAPSVGDTDVGRARSWGEVGSRVSQAGLAPLGATATKGWSTAQPKTNNNVASTAAKSPPWRSVFDICNADTSDDDDGDESLQTFHDEIAASSAAVSALRLSPPVAEAKEAAGSSCGNGDARSGEDGNGSASPEASSDGGWPETKRCPPPNLRACRENSKSTWPVGSAAVAAGSGGYREKDKCKASGLSSRGGSTTSDRVGITGEISYGGVGITGRVPTNDALSSLSTTNGLKTDGSPASAWRADTSTGNGLVNGRLGLGVDADDWMSDAEDRGSAQPPVAAQKGTPAARTGLKRGRIQHARSPDDHGSGGDSSRGSGGGRGEKTGRSERYPAPVPRRQRSSSLSLSPPHFTAFGSDYDSGEDSEPEPLSTGVLGSRANGKSSASRRRSSTKGEGDGRGRKRGNEELLNDRIEAMRVGSDGEGPHGGESSGRTRGRLGGTGGNRADPMGELRPC